MAELKRIMIPTLSERGYIEDTRLIMAYIMSCYYTTDKKQSLLYNPDLISLPYTYYKHINDPKDLADAINNDISKLLSYYYETVDVETEARITDSVFATIALYATVIDRDGKKVGIGNLVNFDTKGLGRVIEINNYGDGLSYLRSL